jgi:Protein of unknown function (DUF1569)
MAANIFYSSDFDLILQRIDQLTNQSQRRWGKMNLPQMLEHCAIQLKKALGISPATKAQGPALFRTSFGRWMALYAFPWPKGSNTPADMNMEINSVSVQSFEHEKAQLVQLLQQVQQKDSLGVHPFFGAVNKKDWGRLIWKHLGHHLRQFDA